MINYSTLYISICLLISFACCKNPTTVHNENSTVKDSLISFTLQDGAFCETCKDVTVYKTSQPESTTKCFVNNEFMVLTQESDEDLGENFLIFSSDDELNNQLEINLKDTLYSLNKDDFGYPWFMGLYKNYLLIDEGSSAQARTIYLIDLKTGQTITQQSTCGEKVEFDGEKLSFWNWSELPRDSVCPETQEWEEYGGATAVIEQIQYDIATNKTSSLKNYKCSMME